MIKNIKISNWRQFSKINLDFDKTLTVLTGVNGAGKTTILDIISYLFGFNYSYASIPKRNSYGELTYSNSIFDKKVPDLDSKSTYKIIGNLSYISTRARRTT